MWSDVIERRLSLAGFNYNPQEIDFDFSRIFEDDNLFEPDIASSGEPGTCPTRQAPSRFTNHRLNDHSTMHHPPRQDPCSTGGELVNLYMIVDPRTGRMTCPKQMLTFKNGNSMSTAFVGSNSYGDDIKIHRAADSDSTDIFQAIQHQKQQQQQQQQQQRQNPKEELNLYDVFSNAQKAGIALDPSAPEEQSTLPGVPMGMPATPPATVQPLRPLSAYNFFFQAEREKILHGWDGQDDFSEERKHRLLTAHWSRDRTKKRRHRKSHGRISFISLSKEISSRWKALSEDRKQFYRDVAAMDFARYQRESKEMEESCPRTCGATCEWGLLL